jgi:hypothetical protein
MGQAALGVIIGVAVQALLAYGLYFLCNAPQSALAARCAHNLADLELLMRLIELLLLLHRSGSA